ncbi:unnamed protein product [Urochloa decumbens]|uniref:F-box domain-containing protein n=1 Tax=Urochloa decumbens TaxID=240449 RepID=A0ABC9BZ59_9POAL
MISRLPDDLLSEVISFLPAADGARTQVLSCRWRSPSLNLHDKTFAAAATILPSQGRRFSLTCLSHYYEGVDVIDGVLRLPGLDGLRELELCYSPTCRTQPALSMTLKGVIISEGTLYGVLSGCPVLRSLVLKDNAGHRRLRLRSPTLRSLSVSDNGAGVQGGNLEEVIIEDAPLLERLITDGCGSEFQAPKLKIVGYLGDGISEYLLGKRVLKALSHWKLNNARAKPKSVPRHVSFECLDEHLKMLELKSYRGIVLEFSLIRFFLSNARVLESMKVLVSPGKWGPKSIARHRKKLRLSTRASRGAKFSFEPEPEPEPDHCPSSSVPIKRIHNFALDDPFGIPTT